MMMRTILRNRTAMTPAAVVAACGLTLGLNAFTAPVQAQSDQRQDAREWEAGQGFHDEEWYDPSDWFDDDFDGIKGADTDYEFGYTYGQTGSALYDDTEYVGDWWYDADRSVYLDGYYDGYFDGYEDDAFGYDHYAVVSSTDVTNYASERYRDGYNDGYYDGFYDAELKFSADWTYYIFSTPIRDSESDAQRQADDSRERGDRADKAKTDRMDDSTAKQYAESQDRIRGTVSSVKPLGDDRVGDAMKGHTVLSLTMNDGSTVVCDLGPNAGSDVISEGDRVTIRGERVQRDDRDILDATRLTVNDTLLWNSKGNNEPTKVSQR